MFQRILNFVIGNPILLIIVLGGIFNVTVRIAQKTREQRAKRDALHEMARRKQEALRTGRSMSGPAPSSVSPVPMQDAKAQRRERIEALRQERMEQLRALREKRAGSPAGQAAASFSSASQNHPNMPPIPVQARPQQSNPQQSQSPQPTRRQQPQQRPQPRQPQRSQGAAQPRRRQIVATSQPAQSTRRRTPQARPPEPRSQASRGVQPARPSKDRSAGSLETIRDASKSARPHLSKPEQTRKVGSTRSMLRSRSSIRQAMVLREILDTPVGLRDQDIASGSLFS